MPKLRVLLVVAVVALAATACGDDESPTSATTSTVATSTSAPPTSTTPTSVATTAAPKGTVVGEQGIGKLRLGMSIAEAKTTGEIGPVGPGCELAGPEEMAADLKAGSAVGSVTFRNGALLSFNVRSGAKTAAGVGPGSTVAQIQQAYGGGEYDVEVDHATEEQFGITLVRVQRSGKTVFEFDVPTDTGKARSVSVPDLRVCE